MNWEIINGTLTTPEEIIQNGKLTVEETRISRIGKKSDSSSKIQIDLNGLLVFPGFINGHDHLLGTYLPRVGDRKPYLNWLAWDNDLKSAPAYAERQQIESNDLYEMGGYRHLLCGVTSVQDHIPHFVRDLFAQNVPIRMIDQYALAHSITSFALKWGESIEKEHARANENDIPFVAHCSEGFDEETIRSVSVLQEKNALSKNTVLIHGIAFSDEDIRLLAENKCNVVWCPASNIYMFDQTAPVKKLIQNGVNVCLGTDSPMSGSINLFEEIYIAKKFYERAYGEKLDNNLLAQMLTSNPAKAFSLHDRGALKEGNQADFVIINGDSKDPYRALTEMNYEDIMLVVIGGKPRYADENFIPLFEALNIKYQKIKVDGFKKILDGDILGLLSRIRKSVGFHKTLEFLPVEPW